MAGLSARAYPVGGSGTSVDVFVTVQLTAPRGDGLKTVEVRDRGDYPIRSFALEKCPERFDTTIERVSTYQLPLRIVVMTCSGQSHSEGDLLPPDVTTSSDAAGPSLGCNPLFARPPSAACTNAANAVLEVRGAALAQCAQAREAQGRREAARELSAALAGVAAALFAAGAAMLTNFFTAPLGAILLGVAGGLLYLSVVELLKSQREAARAREAMTRFEQERAALQGAIEEARRHCCPGEGLFDASDVSCS